MFRAKNAKVAKGKNFFLRFSLRPSRDPQHFFKRYDSLSIGFAAKPAKEGATKTISDKARIAE